METAASVGGGPLVFAFLVATLTLLLFVWLWKASQARDPIEQRIKELGLERETQQNERKSRRLFGKRRATGPGSALAYKLSQADMPVTATEFTMITLALMLLALVIGAATRGIAAGLLLALLVYIGSQMLLSGRAKKRVRLMNEQLPDVLTLLVSGLRAGQGINQALRLVVEQMPDPSASEFARVVQAVELGQPLGDALEEMAERVGSDDVAMMVTAINVQRQTGGNLAETLEIIADTIRDRIRLQGEIRTLTAQQRLSGNILAVLPMGLAVVVWLLDPTFYEPFLEPGPFRALPIGALVMQGIGYYLIQRIVAIDV
ncbi:MAG: secretion system protein [Chloroflexi bacterium]|nr:secretion system protein [Chloroflexota bacterium]